MSSSGADGSKSNAYSRGEKSPSKEAEEADETAVAENGSIPPSYDHTHRRLKSRHVQVRHPL